MMVLIGILFLLFIFQPWFSWPGTLSAGDWPYLFVEQIKEFSWLPEIRFLWLAPYYQIITKFFVETLGLNWHIAERMLWFWPWIILSFFSAKKLTNSVIGGLIYSTNTYALMLVGGGQMGVAMAYALAPLVFFRVWLLPIQVMFDPRIALLTIVAILGYKRNIKQLVLPILVTIVIHVYWWVPLINNPSVLSVQFQEATSEAVKYLSFASLSNTISLSHPNWPENVFGKVYFQKPEFLLLPVVAFASLLFKTNIYFALLAITGIFFAKGANPPFGELYVWLFDKLPGFSLFRDPTKFYLFIALGYAVLVPMTLEQAITYLKKKIWGKYVPYVSYVVFFIFLFYWAYTIRYAINGNLTGTFQPVVISPEYVKLADQAVAWYPKKSRFSLNGGDYRSFENVQYVVVPDDVRGEIFITDRAYDDSKRQDAIQYFATMSGVVRVDEYRDLAVFEVIQ